MFSISTRISFTNCHYCRNILNLLNHFIISNNFMNSQFWRHFQIYYLTTKESTSQMNTVVSSMDELLQADSMFQPTEFCDIL